MKPLYTWALATALLFSLQASFAQTTFPYTEKADSIFENIDKSLITTGILYDRAPPISRFDLYNAATDTVNYALAKQTYYELYQATYQRAGFTEPSGLDKRIDLENFRGRIPIMVMDYWYNKLDTLALQDNLLAYNSNTNTLTDVPGRSRSPYFLQHLQMVAPVVNEVNTNTVTFFLASDYVMQNTGAGVQQIQLDFGSGPQILAGPSGSVTITFSTGGPKDLLVTTTLTNGSSFTTRCHIVIGGSNYEARVQGGFDPCAKQIIDAVIPFQGYDETQPYLGRLEANYYYRTNGGVACDGGLQTLNKPILILDGYDPAEERDAAKIVKDYLKYVDDVNYPYNPPGQVTAPFVTDELRNLGYDVIIVNMPKYERSGKLIIGGSDYVERNAFALIELINRINQQLAAQGSQEKLVIIGPSMGGQISRYALKYMEDNNMNHNCRLWVSFDSNHEGAIVPSGEQFFFDWAAGLSDKLRQAKEAILDCPAAKQFILNHYLYNKTTGSPDVGGAPGFFDRYYQTIDALGWPQQCRKIAMISGAQNGAALPIPQAGQLAMNLSVSLRRGGALVSVLCDLFLPSCRFLDVNLYTAPAPNTHGPVAIVAMPFILSSTVYGINGSNLTRNQSLEVVQSGYYWGYRELTDQLPKDIKDKASINLYTGYHSHQPTAGTLAYGKGINPTAYNFKWDEDVTPYNLACDGYIPFDFYFGPEVQSVKHDSLFYYQAKVLIEEIQGIQHNNKKPFRFTVGTDYVTGTPWCVGHTQTFYVPNAPPGLSCNWTINHQGLEIISGQGTSQITVSYNYPYAPPVQILVAATGSSPCYDYDGYLRMMDVDLFNQAEIEGWWTSGGRSAQLKFFRDINIIPDATSAQVYVGSTTRDPNNHYPYTNITYTLLNNPPIAYSWSQNNGVLSVLASSTRNSQNALLFRVDYGSVCDPALYSKEFSLLFANVRMRVMETSNETKELFLKNGTAGGQLLDVEIYDAKGSLLRRQKGTITDKQLKTDLSNVANGIYFLKAQTKGGLIVQKVFINK